MDADHGMLGEALGSLRAGLRLLFQDRHLSAEFNWEVSGRTVSEIGGRLIEDFVLSQASATFHDLQPSHFDTTNVIIPPSGRALEDMSVSFSRDGSTITLLVDVKGHNQYRVGARPNLASIRKCIDLYSNPLRASEEIVIFFCRYQPSVPPGGRGHVLHYDIREDSFGETGIFPLRWLARMNLDPANIGSGGQLLLARENDIRFEQRSREGFVDLLTELRRRLRSAGADASTDAV